MADLLLSISSCGAGPILPMPLCRSMETSARGQDHFSIAFRNQMVLL